MSGNNSATSNVLSLIGWDEGLAIPVANDENQGLIKAVDKRQRDIEQIRGEDDTMKDKIDALTSHLKNVRQELTHTQGLVTACVREQETESHIMKVGQREEGRLKQEIERLMKNLAEMKQKKNQLENRIYTQAASLEEMKSQMNWDQQALEAWLDESEKKAEDALALEKYRRQDEGKIRELNLQQERLTNEALQKRNRLEGEVIETQTKRVELDKTAEEFRRLHRERAELITQWESNIDRMQQRDREIDAAASHLAAQKKRVMEKEEVIREKQQFLDSQVDNNREQDKKITLAERQCVRTKLALNDAEQQKDQFREQLEVLKRTCDRTASDLEATRSQVTHLKKEVINMKNRLEQATRTRQELQERLKRVTNSKLTAEEEAAAMDGLMEKEEMTQKKIEDELKHQRDIEFRANQKLHSARVEEKNISAAIDGSRAAIKNLRSRIQKMDHEVLKQQEILYTQDFNTQQLERRINRMQGETSNEEKMALEARIAELNAEHADRINTKETLHAQLKHLQDDIRRVKRDMEKIGTERESLNSKINELNLHNDSSQREFKRIRNAKQDLLVEDNIMKLEIKRLRELLYTRADGVLEMETRRQQLETSIKERRAEIAIHMDMLRSQMRAADEERQQYSSELHARSSQIDKLQKRYEIVMVAMAPPEGEEEKSQAYYVIKAAQEKEALQREGDMLDAKIRKAEKEIRALENSLRVVNSSNEAYRKTCTKVSDSSEELQDRARLEEQLRAANDKYKHKRRQIRELSEELETMNETLDSLRREEEELTEQQEQLTNQMASKERERREHLEKMDRAEKVVARAVRELRGGRSEPSNDEKDIEIREQREFNRRVASELVKALRPHNEALSTAENYLQEAGVPIPSMTGTPASRVSSRSGSQQSSAASSARSSARSSGRAAPAVGVVSLHGGITGSSVGSARSAQSSTRSGRR